jgi:plasmid stabilization system protein ParE
MVYEIIWSPRAASDLVGIVQHISVDNPTAAAKFAERLLDHVEHLAKFPLLGRVYHRTSRREVREFTEPPYRIFYRVDEPKQRVVVLTLWHGARREPKL